ncbi:MAG: VWA domain-containing protein [Verrucomicrobiota bacterium]
MLTFAHLWLALLLPLPLLIRWLAPPRQRSEPALRVPFLERVDVTSEKNAKAGTHLKASAVSQALVWVLLIGSLMRPQWLEAPIEREIPTRDLLLLVDLSGSMQAEDFTNAEGENVDRLTAVKEVVGDFLENREGDRVGLAVFGDAPFLQVPFTTDLELCRQLLDETAIGMAGPKTALGDAIGLGINLFEESTTPEKTIIALTDGNDTGSAVPPIEASRIASDREIRIHTVAIGDPETVGEEKLDEATLESMAQNTGGSHYLALNREELVGVYEALDALETTEISTVSHRPRRDLYYWPLAFALLLSVLFHSLRLLRVHSLSARRSAARVRVNSRTFELEIEST